MAPRLNHRKSVHGCSRCKKRRVKCDEVKPSCSACTRHNVRCEYVAPSLTQHSSPNNTSFSSPDSPINLPASSTDAACRTAGATCFSQSPHGLMHTSISAEHENASLEWRLVHYYLLYTSKSFSIADEMWQHRIPLVAYQNRSVLDGILALAAGHLYREAIQAGDDRNADVPRPQPTYRKVTVDHRAFLAGKSPLDMRKISHDYFQACVRNHRQALADRLHRDYEAAYVSSVIILCYSLFTLGEEDDGKISENSDEILWFTLAIGPRQIVVEWQQSAAGIDVLRYWGQFDQQPDLSDEEELFRPSHAEPWSALLLWATEYENISPQDQQAYERTMAFIGLIYKCIVNRSEPATATCRRIVALPARVPAAFTDMVLRRQPRALIILAHVFGMMKAIESEIIWFRGTPEKQIRHIHETLPSGWRKAMQWPLKTIVAPHEDGLILPRPMTMEQIMAG